VVRSDLALRAVDYGVVDIPTPIRVNEDLDREIFRNLESSDNSVCPLFRSPVLGIRPILCKIEFRANKDKGNIPQRESYQVASPTIFFKVRSMFKTC
jgi:hypothetical protein